MIHSSLVCLSSFRFILITSQESNIVSKILNTFTISAPTCRGDLLKELLGLEAEVIMLVHAHQVEWLVHGFYNLCKDKIRDFINKQLKFRI